MYMHMCRAQPDMRIYMHMCRAQPDMRIYMNLSKYILNGPLPVPTQPVLLWFSQKNLNKFLYFNVISIIPSVKLFLFPEWSRFDYGSQSHSVSKVKILQPCWTCRYPQNKHTEKKNPWNLRHNFSWNENSHRNWKKKNWEITTQAKARLFKQNFCFKFFSCNLNSTFPACSFRIKSSSKLLDVLTPSWFHETITWQ